MSEERRSSHEASPAKDREPISWWSWRPGIQPRNALLSGGLISVVALLLIGIGAVTLVLAILDSFSPPLEVAGSVYEHTINKLDGQPYLRMRLHASGPPAVATATVSHALFQSIHDGESILLVYSPHLHVLYAVELAGQRYILPGGSIFLDFIGSLSLLLIGGILLPYPALLMRWGWRDLMIGREAVTLRGTIVGLRASVPARRGRSGLVPRAARPWYGVAIQSAAGDIKTFALSLERFASVHEDDSVKITYSPHVHFVYEVEQISAIGLSVYD